MFNYMYPAQAEQDENGKIYQWVKDMLDEWEQSKMRYLCFPYARDPKKNNCPKYLIDHANGKPFWLFMYYRKEFAMGGEVRFRIHVCGLRSKNYKIPPPNRGIYNSSNVHLLDSFPGMEVTLRLICDEFEEIRLTNDDPVRIENFKHPNGKDIPALMRHPYVGIPPVNCLVENKIEVIHRYPQGR